MQSVENILEKGFTFKVSRQEMNFFRSPINIALLTTGSSLFTTSSTTVGATFSPPAVMSISDDYTYKCKVRVNNFG